MAARVLLLKLLKVGFSTSDFYSVANAIYKYFFGAYCMLHYPLHRGGREDLLQCQRNLTDHCLAKLPSLQGKRVLEIGCGNGVQTGYILSRYRPAYITGIDLSPANLRIAQEQKLAASMAGVEFLLDDAQRLSQLQEESHDAVVNIESAFHYPDKCRFLQQVHRVLKPGGVFLIADILNRRASKDRILSSWRKRMSLNHWTRSEYLRAMGQAGLELVDEEDITRAVLRGFRHSRLWTDGLGGKDLSMKILGYVWARGMNGINALLLRTLRQYHVFCGFKPPA